MILYVVNLDVHNYDNQNMNAACLLLWTLVRSLGYAVFFRCLLVPTEMSSSWFAQPTALYSVAYCGTMESMSTQACMFSILLDLETKYTKLFEAKKWNGISHK